MHRKYSMMPLKYLLLYQTEVLKLILASLTFIYISHMEELSSQSSHYLIVYNLLLTYTDG